MEGDMSDPRYTDPRYGNSLSDPVSRRSDVGGTWGWVAGIVVIALIAVFLIAGGQRLDEQYRQPAAWRARQHSADDASEHDDRHGWPGAIPGAQAGGAGQSDKSARAESVKATTASVR